MKLLDQLNYVDVVARKGSIRKAAEVLNITSTALNRRILALEEELGTEIFERLPQGVRLNVAGELLIQHIRRSMSELARLQSQISDLSGVRRGHVSIAAGPEIVGRFLPQHIASYRHQFADVSFAIKRCAPQQALRALQEFDCDVALLCGAMPPSDYLTLLSVELPLTMLMAEDHPLAKLAEISFVDCLDFPAILPAEGTGLYDVILANQQKRGTNFRSVITSESHDFMAHYSAFEQAISFAVSFGKTDTPTRLSGLVERPFRRKEAISIFLHLSQLKGRVLPVAAAKFVEEMRLYFSQNFPDDVR